MSNIGKPNLEAESILSCGSPIILDRHSPFETVQPLAFDEEFHNQYDLDDEINLSPPNAMQQQELIIRVVGLDAIPEEPEGKSIFLRLYYQLVLNS